MKADFNKIKSTIRDNGIVLSLHAYEEAFAEDISVDDIKEALLNGTIIEDYATHRRGPCCLVYGQTDAGRLLLYMNRKHHSGLHPLPGVREVKNEQMYALS